MLSARADLTIEALADEAGVSVRTVRYYISQGLLPGPGARGRAASYRPEHLARLRLIRRLSEQHVPLAEQRDQLARLTPDEVESLLGEEERRGAARETAKRAPSPRTYVAEVLERARGAREQARPRPRLGAPTVHEAQAWQRWELAPGIELHARADVARHQAPLVQRLLRAAIEEGN